VPTALLFAAARFVGRREWLVRRALRLLSTAFLDGRTDAP
jgi:hypothetical protein